MREDQVFIHYNGWGQRWDEWIERDSSRLAVFRSYTVQNPKSNYLSPIPNIMPEQNQRIQQQYVEYSLSSTMSEVLTTVNKAMGLLSEFHGAREKKNKELSVEEEKKDTKMQDDSTVIFGQVNQVEEEKKEEVNNPTNTTQQSR